MTYKTHNDDNEIVALGRYQESINCDYKILKKLFGIPIEGSDKTDAEWYIEFDDGVLSHIYNYKDGKNYLGSKGKPKTKITDWHIGGLSIESVNHINIVLEEYNKIEIRKKKIKSL